METPKSPRYVLYLFAFQTSKDNASTPYKPRLFRRLVLMAANRDTSSAEHAIAGAYRAFPNNIIRNCCYAIKH
jgi:hypothetical protein